MKLALGAAIVLLRWTMIIALARFRRTRHGWYWQVALVCVVAETSCRIRLTRLSARSASLGA